MDCSALPWKHKPYTVVFQIIESKKLEFKRYHLNGIEDEYSEKAIENFSNPPVPGRINNIDICYKESISTEGNSLIHV